jgi:hypothetical protein
LAICVGRQELRLLDVDRRAGLGHGAHQIRLPGEKGRQLDDVADLGGRRRLLRRVHVRDHRHRDARS